MRPSALAVVFGALGAAWGWHVADRFGLVVGAVVLGVFGRAVGRLLIANATPAEWDDLDTEWESTDWADQ